MEIEIEKVEKKFNRLITSTFIEGKIRERKEKGWEEMG